MFNCLIWGHAAGCPCQKHCQRHNGPEGWVLITKVSYLGHITSSQTNLDQISSSKSWLNIASESRPRIIFIIATKGQQQNIDLTSASKSFAKILRAKSGQKIVFMTKLQLLSINTSNSNNLNKFWVGIFTSQGHINQVYLTGVSQWVSESVNELLTSIPNDRTRVR